MAAAALREVELFGEARESRGFCDSQVWVVTYLGSQSESQNVGLGGERLDSTTHTKWHCHCGSKVPVEVRSVPDMQIEGMHGGKADGVSHSAKVVVT